MDSTAKAENLAIDPKMLAWLENLESQWNPDFNLGFNEWLASQTKRVFKEQLNSPSAEENGKSVNEGIQPPTQKLKILLSLKKKHQLLKNIANKVLTICLSGDRRD